MENIKRFMNNTKANAAVYLIFLVLLVFITMIYMFFSQVLSVIEPQALTYLNETANQTTYGKTLVANAVSTFNTLNVVWKYWPIFLIFGLLIFVFIASTSRGSTAQD